MKYICFAGGCFWGTEHYIRQFEGVLETDTGYANGRIASPTYEQVYTDQTGFAECVKIGYDPEIISLRTLCRLFFRSIDPLALNRQGEDCGTRYRTGIYWTDEAEIADIEAVYHEVQNRHDKPLAVEKCRLECFYPAEQYHQDYLINNPDGYCHLSLQTLAFARTYSQIHKALRESSRPEKRAILSSFFKTGKGQYGEGDRFMGVTVPDTRSIARRFVSCSFDVLEALLESEWHENRLCALLILREKYKTMPDAVVDFYLQHTEGINNWDLVDQSAPYILGDYLVRTSDRELLYRLAASPVMWENRIAIVSTLMLIRNNQFDDTMKLAEIMMSHPHDLMHKSIGWMLREVGKRNEGLLKDFLYRYSKAIPRTTLRYAIEKFPEAVRKEFMRL